MPVGGGNGLMILVFGESECARLFPIISRLPISMLRELTSRIQLELIPMIQEIVLEWLIILLFCISPSELPSIEDFNPQLSSLQFGI
ncbi:hypothetical protein QYF36_023955 [Acer negundo]|nr:hypothetical protein QYF36_023955 [Acer negundo]